MIDDPEGLWKAAVKSVLRDRLGLPIGPPVFEGCIVVVHPCGAIAMQAKHMPQVVHIAPGSAEPSEEGVQLAFDFMFLSTLAMAEDE